MNFGAFHFRQADRTLWRDSERVHMTAKARDLLACLVAAKGRFVSKSEIMSAVWPDIHVLPDNIKVLIHEIRSVLDEDARHPHFIRSEAGLGYAFVPEGLTTDPGVTGERHHGLFLNRTRELAELAEAFEDARTGSGRVVLISGERGIGKSALCDRFLRIAAAETPLRTIKVQCRETASAARSLEPVLEALHLLELEQPSSGADTPSWAAIRGGGRVPAGGLTVLITEWFARLATVSRDLPVVLVLEDLQSADSVTHRFVGQLSRLESPGRSLVIATMCDGCARDGRSASLRRLMRTRLPARLLHLDPLTPGQVGRYLDARFGADRLTALTVPLHEVTGGNPALMVSAIEGLIENRVLPAHPDALPAVLDIPAMINVLPYVLRDAMTRQLDQLDPDTRALLEAASLVGTEVTVPGVATVAGTDIPHVKRVFSTLLRRGCILLPAGNPSAVQAADGPYRFQHPMYAHLLSERASVGQRFRATQRLALARDSPRTVVRPGRAHDLS